MRLRTRAAVAGVRPGAGRRMVFAAIASLACACSRGSRDDASFAALQDRGREAMGVDQYTSSHRFEPLPDGGRIVLQRDSLDPAGAEAIRTHMRHIAGRFAEGDFSIPGFVHDGTVPGTGVMAERRALIRYEADTLPRGGEVRIVTTDSAAIAAVHAFLAFQRMDHRAHGRH
jgi:hypothetical protein